MDRFEGFWWSPDSQTLAYEEADLAPVQTLYIPDPMHPEQAPNAFRYPRAGTPNAGCASGLIPRTGGRDDLGAVGHPGVPLSGPRDLDEVRAADTAGAGPATDTGAGPGRRPRHGRDPRPADRDRPGLAQPGAEHAHPQVARRRQRLLLVHGAQRRLAARTARQGRAVGPRPDAGRLPLRRPGGRGRNNADGRRQRRPGRAGGSGVPRLTGRRHADADHTGTRRPRPAVCQESPGLGRSVLAQRRHDGRPGTGRAGQSAGVTALRGRNAADPAEVRADDGARHGP